MYWRRFAPVIERTARVDARVDESGRTVAVGERTSVRGWARQSGSPATGCGAAAHRSRQRGPESRAD